MGACIKTTENKILNKKLPSNWFGNAGCKLIIISSKNFKNSSDKNFIVWQIRTVGEIAEKFVTINLTAISTAPFYTS